MKDSDLSGIKTHLEFVRLFRIGSRIILLGEILYKIGKNSGRNSYRPPPEQPNSISIPSNSYILRIK